MKENYLERPSKSWKSLSWYTPGQPSPGVVAAGLLCDYAEITQPRYGSGRGVSRRTAMTCSMIGNPEEKM